MSLKGLKKEEREQPKKSVNEFVYGATNKMADHTLSVKDAKRDQGILLKLNHYEIDLINKVFESSKCRSKQELIRGLLLPELERISDIK